MSRTKNSLRNLITSLIFQFFALIISFVARMIFVRVLGTQYLGLNGLFTNILSILSLAELGVGEAITFSLYKPLATGDDKKCASLMNLFRRIYYSIGLLVFAAGLLLIPILPSIVDDISSIPNIYLIYVLFVLNTSVSYFGSYKRTLIIADQKKYITTIVKSVVYLLLNISQIICLFVTKDYIAFLVIQVIMTILENIIISIKANSIFPFLRANKHMKVERSMRVEIIKNTKAMLMHKLGGVFVTSTDNIILSKFVSLLSVGIYSNYCLIISAINSVLGQFYSSVMASVGNLNVKGSVEKKYRIFLQIDLLGFIIYSVATTCLLSTFNCIIAIWLGDSYTFDFGIVVLIVLNFYIAGLRKSIFVYREATGVFYYDRWKAIIEGIINLVISILLGKALGVIGVLIGTTASALIPAVWIESGVLYKYCFERKLSDYIRRYLKYAFTTIISCTVASALCYLIPTGSIPFLLCRIIISLIISLLVIFVLFRKDDVFISVKRKIRGIIGKVGFLAKNRVRIVLKNHPTIYSIYNKVGSILIRIIGLFVFIDKKTVLFNSFGGSKYNDSPRVIYEYMCRNAKYDSYKLIWVFDKKPDCAPSDILWVKNNTIRFFIIALKAKYWITNSSIERGLKFKKRKTVYINTWHGSALKLMGNDTCKKTKKFNVSKSDIFYCQSEYDKRTFMRAFGYPESAMKIVGLPRNDELAKVTKEEIRALKVKLHLPKDKKIILYAPTFRDYATDKNGCFMVPPLNIEKWRRELSDKYVILFRAHYEVARVANIAYDDFIVDVTNHQNLNELLKMSDVLVSDYSSIMIDYSILERPIFAYTYDLDEYIEKRGLYLDLNKVLPNGVQNSEDELINSIKTMCISEQKQRTRNFKNRFVEKYGNATEYIDEIIKPEL